MKQLSASIHDRKNAARPALKSASDKWTYSRRMSARYWSYRVGSAPKIAMSASITRASSESAGAVWCAVARTIRSTSSMTLRLSPVFTRSSTDRAKLALRCSLSDRADVSTAS